MAAAQVLQAILVNRIGNGVVSAVQLDLFRALSEPTWPD